MTVIEAGLLSASVSFVQFDQANPANGYNLMRTTDQADPASLFAILQQYTTRYEVPSSGGDPVYNGCIVHNLLKKPTIRINALQFIDFRLSG